MTQPLRPPIPTREEVAAAHVGIPGPALLRFVAKMQPHRHNLTAGQCVGKAPLFDTDQLEGETHQQHRHRLAHAAELCQTHPELAVCWLCGNPIDMQLPPHHPNAFTLDHIIPLARGGNLHGETKPAHRTCNSQRGQIHKTQQPKTILNW